MYFRSFFFFLFLFDFMASVHFLHWPVMVLTAHLWPVIAGSIDEATWQTKSVSTAAHSQHWLCSRMNKQNRLTSPFLEHTTVMQKFCQHWPSMHVTVWTRFNFHAVFYVKYYTSAWTLTARSWPEQIRVSTGCCCSNFTFWVTWKVASSYFLNANPIRIADGVKEHTLLCN